MRFHAGFWALLRSCSCTCSKFCNSQHETIWTFDRISITVINAFVPLWQLCSKVFSHTTCFEHDCLDMSGRVMDLRCRPSGTLDARHRRPRHADAVEFCLSTMNYGDVREFMILHVQTCQLSRSHATILITNWQKRRLTVNVCFSKHGDRTSSLRTCFAFWLTLWH